MHIRTGRTVPFKSFCISKQTFNIIDEASMSNVCGLRNRLTINRNLTPIGWNFFLRGMRVYCRRRSEIKKSKSPFTKIGNEKLHFHRHWKIGTIFKSCLIQRQKSIVGEINRENCREIRRRMSRPPAWKPQNASGESKLFRVNNMIDTERSLLCYTNFLRLWGTGRLGWNQVANHPIELRSQNIWPISSLSELIAKEQMEDSWKRPRKAKWIEFASSKSQQLKWAPLCCFSWKKRRITPIFCGLCST